MYYLKDKFSIPLIILKTNQSTTYREAISKTMRPNHVHESVARSEQNTALAVRASS